MTQSSETSDSMPEPINSEAAWLSAKKTLAQMIEDGADPRQSVDAIAFFLREGQLQARAKQIWTSDKRSIRLAWKDRPSLDYRAPYVAVPVGRWRHEIDVIGDRERFRWRASRFAVTLKLKPRKRVMMRGVQFLRADLASVFPKYFDPDEPDIPVTGKRDPKPEWTKRDIAWGMVVELILDGTLKPAADLRVSFVKERMKDRLTIGPSARSRAGKNITAEVASKATAELQKAYLSRIETAP